MLEMKKVTIYLFLKTQDATGQDAFYYLAMKASKFPEFKKRMLGSQDVNLKQYAEILYSGYGTNPSPEEIKKMEDEYGFKHDNVITLDLTSDNG